MSRKDYIRGAEIVKVWHGRKKSAQQEIGHSDEAWEMGEIASAMEDAFVSLFRENPAFNEHKFRAACQSE